MEKFWFTYVLESLKDRKYYYGHTQDLFLRLKQHNSRKVASTKARTPFRLIYFEGCRNRIKAIEREKYFKTGFGRVFLDKRIGH